ncbi:unnamed protein product, partial [Ceratitis capitata]
VLLVRFVADTEYIRNGRDLLATFNEVISGPEIKSTQQIRLTNELRNVFDQ